MNNTFITLDQYPNLSNKQYTESKLVSIASQLGLGRRLGNLILTKLPNNPQDEFDKLKVTKGFLTSNPSDYIITNPNGTKESPIKSYTNSFGYIVYLFNRGLFYCSYKDRTFTKANLDYYLSYPKINSSNRINIMNNYYVIYIPRGRMISRNAIELWDLVELNELQNIIDLF